MKIFGIVCINISVLCCVTIIYDLKKNIYSWRLINILMCPVNMVMGARFLMCKSYEM